MSGTWKRLQDWLTVVIGLLFIAPFVLGATANQAAAWTAYAGGVLLVWSAWMAGILAGVLAGSVVLNERDRPQLVGQR
jgi:hypothetical protein